MIFWIASTIMLAISFLALLAWHHYTLDVMMRLNKELLSMLEELSTDEQ